MQVGTGRVASLVSSGACRRQAGALRHLGLRAASSAASSQASAARVAETLRLVAKHSEEAHPGHGPGRFAGPGAEYEAMEHLGGNRWRLTTPASASDALATLTDADEALATRFESEGGLGLLLSSAFRLPDELREQSRKALREAATKPGGLDVDGLEQSLSQGGPTGLCQQALSLLKAADAAEEREAVMRNVWSDVEFQAGANGNAELVARLELQFATQLVRTATRAEASNPSVSQALQSKEPGAKGQPFSLALRQPEAESLLADLTTADLTATLSLPRNLGVGLDLVGVYLKNYELDKAGDVIERVEPLARLRGGVWLIKALDKMSAVRMKQFRAQDAMKALLEIETLVPFKPEEGWEFHDILYRNLAWCFSSLDEPQRCLEYTRKSAEVKQKAGIPATWFDLWDLGKAHARIGQLDGSMEEMQMGHDLCTRAAEIHRKAEATESIMLAKILSNVGEICMGIGDHLFRSSPSDAEAARRWYEQAETPLREAYELHVAALGPSKPLSGWQAGTVAHCLVRLERWAEARHYLALALHVECTKDATTPGSVIELLERVTAVHEKLQDDGAGMSAYTRDLDYVLGDLRARGWSRRELDLWSLLLLRVATARLGGASALALQDTASAAETITTALNLLREAEMCIVAFLGNPGEPRKFGPPVDAVGLLQQVKSSIKVLETGQEALAGRATVPPRFVEQPHSLR